MSPHYKILFLLLASLASPIVSCNHSSSVAEYVKEADKLLQEGKIEETLVLYQKAIRDHPKSSVLYLNQAALFRKEKKFANAIRNYEVAKKLSPDSHWPYLGLGRVYMAEGVPEKAGEVLSSSLERFPGNGALLFYSGINFFQMGQGEQALTYFDKALDAKYQKPADIYYYRGLTFETLLKNAERARLDYQSYLMSDGERADEVKKRFDALKLGERRYDF